MKKAQIIVLIVYGIAMLISLGCVIHTFVTKELSFNTCLKDKEFRLCCQMLCIQVIFMALAYRWYLIEKNNKQN